MRAYPSINAPTNAPDTRADLQRKDEAAVKIQAITRSKHKRLNAHRAKALTEIQNRWECCVCAFVRFILNSCAHAYRVQMDGHTSTYTSLSLLTQSLAQTHALTLSLSRDVHSSF